jgi:hypothetical protein
MPGDEKRGRPPEDIANGAPGGAARSKDRAHITDWQRILARRSLHFVCRTE